MVDKDTPDFVCALSASTLRARVCAAGAAALLLVLSGWIGAEPDSNESWREVTTSNGEARARHEATGVAANGKFYLMGGRGSRPVDLYDPVTDAWSTVASPPIDFHHFHAAVLGSEIYVIGSFIGGFPNETPVADIYVYDTEADEWRTEGMVPEARRRGSVATAVRDGWIYLVGGNTLGHNGGAVPWFDRYQPSTGTWEVLPDAPEARDHHGAAWIGDALVTSGGRRSALPNTFLRTVGPTDVWRDGRWSSVQDIPTERAGAMTVGFEDELIVIGGETEGGAHDEVEAFNVQTGTWRNLQSLNLQRHSGGAAVIGSTLHVVAGATNRGGSPETNSHETLDLASGSPPDSDNDGLSDQQETDDIGTNPNDFDSDNDSIGDGDEVEMGTDPLLSDTDGDGMDDGDETQAGTDPLQSDTDNDGLTDGDEFGVGTDPLSADTDEDGLSDGDEVTEHGTDPFSPDSDEDGLDDLAEVDVWQTDPLLADTDEDGLSDGAEVDLGTNPGALDSDQDGLSDGDEVEQGRDPLLADSDTDTGDASGGDVDGGDVDGDADNTTSDSEPTEPARRGGGGSLAWWSVFALLKLRFLRRGLAAFREGT